MPGPGNDAARIAAATARERSLIAAREGKQTYGGGDQLAALVELARALDDSGIPYALIGGIAVGIHSAVPRATEDIDICVPTSVTDERLTSALSAAGFEPRARHAHSFNFLHRSGEPVRVAFDAGFDPMIERAEVIDVGKASIRIVLKQDLIAMKERAARDPARRKSKALRDESDVELLRGGPPDPDDGW